MNSPLKVSLENIIPLTEARDHFSQIVTEVQQDKLYVLTKGGKPAVAIIDVKYLEAISGGSVKTDQIETEIQKDPAKVGRTQMIKHDLPSSPNIPAEAPKDAPIKINFQPAEPKPLPPTPLGTPPSPATPATAPASPPPTPLTSFTPPPAEPSTLTMPPMASGNNPAPSATPIPIQSSAPSGGSNNMIDIISSSDNDAAPVAPSTSPDDRPGPAQYSGENDDEPKDMEI